MIFMTPVEISATEIRQTVKRAESISAFVPAAVEKYIVEHGLYQDECQQPE